MSISSNHVQIEVCGVYDLRQLYMWPNEKSWTSLKLGFLFNCCWNLLENLAIKVAVHQVRIALWTWSKMEDSLSYWGFLSLPCLGCSVSEHRCLTLFGGWACAGLCESATYLKTQVPDLASHPNDNFAVLWPINLFSPAPLRAHINPIPQTTK